MSWLSLSRVLTRAQLPRARTLRPSHILPAGPSLAPPRRRTHSTAPLSQSLSSAGPITASALTAEDAATVASLSEGIVAGNRSALSRGITLVESTNRRHEDMANELLLQVLRALRERHPPQLVPSSARSRRAFPSADEDSDMQLKFVDSSPLPSFRVGFSGPPGVGKSSFIEVLGMEYVRQAQKVAVLSIDPSSAVSGGSILGDKTRMVELSRQDNAYVRPSPTWGTVGGLTRATAETMVLCEGAGYNNIIVETVGVGQSEIAVRDVTDMVVLLVPPGGGDELQGIKKGIVEIADLIVVTKADGELLSAARHASVEYMHAVQLNRRRSKHWTPKVLMTSTLDGGVSARKVLDEIRSYRDIMTTAGELQRRRAGQREDQMHTQVQQELLSRISRDQSLHRLLQSLQNSVFDNKITPRAAARSLVDELFRDRDAKRTV